MTDYIVQDTSLTAVANKIREKTGDNVPLTFPEDFIVGINKLADEPSAPEDSLLFYGRDSFTLETANNAKNWSDTLTYSTDGNNWTEWNGEKISAGLTGVWYRLFLKGNNNNRISYNENQRFVVMGFGVKCVGNMMNLLNLPEPFTFGDTFNYLFAHNVGMDFDLVFPLEYFNRGGVLYSTFWGCSSMTKAPELPATTLRSNIYAALFKDCISLQEAPVLPATIMAEQCYDNMFMGCTSLKRPPALPATTLQRACYRNMFNGCKSLEALPELPAVTLTSSCYYSMFAYCSKIKISTSQTDEYQTSYRIPSSGEGTETIQSLTSMFASTGGTFTGNPVINTTYYTSNEIIPAT